MSLPSQKVSEIIKKHADLEKELSSSNLDSKSFAQKSKEYSNLNEIIKHAIEYSKFEHNKKDLEKIISDVESDEEMNIPYVVGESVKVIDGPFNNFNGTIENINEEKKKLTVMVKIFGRKTPLELNYMQVDKDG